MAQLQSCKASLKRPPDVHLRALQNIFSGLEACIVSPLIFFELPEPWSSVSDTRQFLRSIFLF